MTENNRNKETTEKIKRLPDSYGVLKREKGGWIESTAIHVSDLKALVNDYEVMFKALQHYADEEWLANLGGTALAKEILKIKN